MRFSHLILVIFVMAATVLAGPRGVYLGGGVGQSFVKTDVSDIEELDLKLADNEFAYKFLAGVRMNEFLALEGGYKYLGNVKDKIEGYTFESKTSGYDLAAVGNLYLGIADVFAKAGAFWWDQTSKVNDEEKVTSNVNFAWGFGATLRLGSLGVRAEWERFELESYDRLSMLSLGVLFGL